MIDKNVSLLVEEGFSIILEHPRSKKPIRKGWTTIPFETVDELNKQYKKGMNYAVRLGLNTKIDGGYLHVIDIDIKSKRYRNDALKALKKVIQNVDTTQYPLAESGSGNGSSHLYFLLKEPHPYKMLCESKETVTGIDGKVKHAWRIELLGNNKAVTIPPSIHPDTLKAYRWVRFPHNIPFFPENIIKDIYKPKPVSNDVDISEKYVGLTIEEARDIIFDLQDLADSRDTWVEVGMALKLEFSNGSEQDLEAAWDLFDEWSKNGQGYDEYNNRMQWDSFKNQRDKLVSMRSLIAQRNDRELYKQLTSFEPEQEIIVENVDGEHFNPFKYLAEEGVPERLLQIPGHLQYFVDWYNKSSKQVQPQFAVQSALALGSVVLSRLWKTNQDNFTSLYLLNIAPTSSGKEHVKKTIDTVLSEAGYSDMIGPKTYSSEAGVLSALKIKPRHISITDEFARYLASTRSTGNVNKQDMQSVLMEVFGRLDGMLTGIGYSTRGMNADQIKDMVNSKVYNPAITLMGMTTPDNFYKAISSSDVMDGFLNRFLIVESKLCRQIDRDTKLTEVPEELIRWIKAKGCGKPPETDTLDALASISDASTEPAITVIPFDSEADELLKQMAREKIHLMDAAEANGLAELFGRSREIAMRISLIIALSCGHDKVMKRDLLWARDYVYYYHKQMAKKFANRLSENSDDQTIIAILKTIDIHERSKHRGMTESKISENCASFRKMKTYNREEIITRMLRDQLITLEEGTPNTRGPMSRKYILTKLGIRRIKL